jgi:hypothetical protein
MQPRTVSFEISAFALMIAAIAEISCGNTASKPAENIDHDRYFVLDGAHANADCTGCHSKGSESSDTPADCAGCHIEDYEASPFYEHDTFPTSCAGCHTTAGWQPATLPNHDKYFEIDGHHATLACASCHTKGYLAHPPEDCVGCHEQDYAASRYPGHSAFAKTCADCHTTAGWTQTRAEHSP